MENSKGRIRTLSIVITFMVLITVSFTSCRDDYRKERLSDFKSPTYGNYGFKSEKNDVKNKIVSSEKELKDRILELEKLLKEKEEELSKIKSSRNSNDSNIGTDNNDNDADIDNNDDGTDDNEENIFEGTYFLRKAPLNLYRGISNHNNEITFVGAWGPRAIIQKLYEGESEEKLKVIEINDEIAKISIEGYIPSWYLTKDSNDHVKWERERNMYVISDSEIRIAPEEEGQIAQKLNGGTAVRILESYGEWYFAELILPSAAEPLNEGWIKQQDLGYLKDVLEFREKNEEFNKESIHNGIYVKVKVAAQELDNDGKVIDINKYEYWGKILEIKEENGQKNYGVGLQGADYRIIRERDIEFITEKNSIENYNKKEK